MSELLCENFDVCRLCLVERGTEGYEPFVHIMTPIDGKLKSKKLVLDLLGIDIESDGVKPKMLCKCCFGSLDSFNQLKKKANENQIVVNYIAKKKFGGTMPETSVASTSSLMLRNNGELSHSMPGTSTASTSSMMLRNNEKASHETPVKSYRSISKRSNEFGNSMPGTSKASTSSMTLRNNKVSSQEPPFKHSRLSSKQSNKFGDSMPGTSKASTSTVTLRNNDESSHETPFKNNRSISKRTNEFGDSMPGTSKASTASMMLMQEIKKERILNERSNSDDYQGSRFLVITSDYEDLSDFSDDGSCIITTAPIETIELISDDEDDDNDNIENVDVSENEETIDLSQDEEIIELSSDSEDNENNIKKEDGNDVTDKLYYCSICQKKNILNHDCSQHTKSFFTCLVPGCNILSRSKKDFTFHYQPHIGMSSSGVMCHRCFKGIDQSNMDDNGYHIYCDMENAFKCYLCNLRYKSIQELAYHKLKSHNGILLNVHGNYLCFHCEESSPDIHEIGNHMKHCLESQAKNETAASMKSKKETELLPIKIKKKNVMVRTNKNNNMIPRTSEHVLFTCLKPSCNVIFQSFSNFKFHYRRHFELGNALVCWQCCKPFSDIPDLRAHQVKNNCRTPGMYKCKCSAKFDDLESLSIHKLTFHGGKLVAGKKNRKTIVCAFCQMDINIFNFKSHLATCRKKNCKQNTCTTKSKGEYTCLTCERVFASSISLSNHSRVHNRFLISNLKKEST
ncbi:zinc finger protein 37 [Acyrthosiphon pisum]|uniref:Uncharacterized protein n=1 Tax=Acyrthosiphon pisum TaxID=7029 RepID=A0A8R2A3U2_ACYPI|nr:zinc finger protein 37 [Acyrthosiphon pisum]|eukprot:XP_001942803.2 PREDICTED: zinc finger protein 37 [Acyrthosiphon pisum]